MLRYLRLLPALPRERSFTNMAQVRRPRRGQFEFVGVLADPDVRKQYINRYVGHLFTPGAQNPISYVNVGRARAGTQGRRAVARQPSGKRGGRAG